MAKDKKRMKKDSIRYRKEVMTKCGTCTSFFNSTCDKAGYWETSRRYKDQPSCHQYISL